MRTSLLVVPLLVVACGGSELAPVSTKGSKQTTEATKQAVCDARPLNPSTKRAVGISHVAGSYKPTSAQGDSFLLAGAEAIAALGSDTIKVYLTPQFREKYPESWPKNVNSLIELATTQQFKKLFDMPFHTFVLTTYSFSSGVGHPWREKANSQLLEAEAMEMEELTRHLLTTYAGTGKTFVLQNWEGDWALLENYDTQSAVDASRMQRMAEWLNTRQAAISRARTAVSENNVFVRHAVEMNRVLDVTTDSARRVVDGVLPNVCTDVVSYSAWEALEFDASSSDDEKVARVSKNLTQAIQTIRSHMAHAGSIYLGEVGFPESQMNLSPATMTKLLNAVDTTARNQGVSNWIYWQIFDNECVGVSSGLDCRGFWVIQPNGELSGAGVALSHLM